MMCYCSKGLDLLRRTLCLFLCVVLLLCFFLVPRAHAVVAEAELAYWGGAIVVSVLAAGGLALASSGDASKVGAAMWTALKDTGGKAYDSIAAMAAWAVSAGSKVKDAAFRVGSDVWQAIKDCFEANKSSFETVSTLTVNGQDLGSDALKNKFSSINALKLQTISINDHVYTYGGDPTAGTFKILCDGDVIFSKDNPLSTAPFYGDSFGAFSLYYSTWSHTTYLYASVVGHYYDGSISDSDFFDLAVSTPFTVGVGVPIDFGDYDLVYPGDDYLVKAPDLPTVDTATGAVSWPSDAVYNKDAIALPYPVDAAGEKVADIPYDVPVDQTTGKDITDADTGETDKPGDKTDTDTDTDVKWPSSGDLSLPKLIISKFPFCIPFDVARLIGLLEADAKAPVFVVPLKYGSVMDEEITLDLSQFSDVIRVVRWGELILFVAGLAYVTRNYIKW